MVSGPRTTSDHPSTEQHGGLTLLEEQKVGKGGERPPDAVLRRRSPHEIGFQLWLCHSLDTGIPSLTLLAPICSLKGMISFLHSEDGCEHARNSYDE